MGNRLVAVSIPATAALGLVDLVPALLLPLGLILGLSP